uniref:Uncharacterized protein n=1 Tax=Quercus lobata TaxID=97700 RepID=A0A7N2MJY0_QUELO
MGFHGCYLNDTAVDGDYFIICTSNAYGQPQPMISNINIISISMEGEIDIQMYNSIDCYDEYGTPLSNNNPSLRVPGFTVFVTKNKFMMLILKPIALKITHKSGSSIHAALPLLSKKTSSISPKIILSVYEAMKLFPWFWIGRLVMRRVKLLGTKRITYVEGIARVLISIPTTDLGTVAIAWSVTVGTHTSKTVAKTLTNVTLRSSITAQTINLVLMKSDHINVHATRGTI